MVRYRLKTTAAECAGQDSSDVQRHVRSITNWATVHRQLERKVRHTGHTGRLSDDIPGAKALEAATADMDAAAEAEKVQLWAEVHEIRSQVQELKKELHKQSPGDTYLEGLQGLMHAIQARLHGIKTQQYNRFQSLQQDAQLYERGVDSFLERLETAAWNEDSEVVAPPQAPSSPAPSTLAARPHGQDGGLMPEVLEFDAYDEEYGATGGWHEDDHVEFERILKATKGDYAASVLACTERMVGFDRLDIVAHARWHSQREELAIRKRLALQKWREEKKIAAAAARTHAHDAIVHESKPSSRSHQSAEAREYTKGVIEEWKACKAEAADIERQRRAAAQAAKRDAERRKREARQAELAAKIERHKAEQLAQASENVNTANLCTAGSAATARPVTPAQRRVVAERNKSLLQRRQAAMQAKREALQSRAKSQEKLAAKVVVKVDRDPSRLLRPTTASQKRLELRAENPPAAKDSVYIRHVPHKAAAALRY